MNDTIRQLIKSDIPDSVSSKLPEGLVVMDPEEVQAHLTESMDFAVEHWRKQVARTATRFGVAGTLLGVGLGAVGGYFITRKRLETKYNDIAEEQIAEMREHYHAKGLALDNTLAKPELDKIIEDRGYGTAPGESQTPTGQPIGISPPEAVVEAAEEAEAEKPAQVKPPVPVDPAVMTNRNVFAEVEANRVEDEWDYQRERAKRSPLKPYVIHVDERDESRNGGYDEVTFTYYEADDVICNERDEVIGEPERDLLVGEANLERFGHGSNDPSIVYIRHDSQELVIELVKSPNSYAEEVHGLKHSDINPQRLRRKRERPPFDDD